MRQHNTTPTSSIGDLVMLLTSLVTLADALRNYFGG
jgi:hypothetical protein